VVEMAMKQSWNIKHVPVYLDVRHVGHVKPWPPTTLVRVNINSRSRMKLWPRLKPDPGENYVAFLDSGTRVDDNAVGIVVEHTYEIDDHELDFCTVRHHELSTPAVLHYLIELQGGTRVWARWDWLDPVIKEDFTRG
jgi:hypothetical protein